MGITDTNTKVEKLLTNKALNGLSEEESIVTAMDSSVKEMKKGIRVLEYFIPSGLNDECPNPSRLLYSLGFIHNDGSCWLLPEMRVSHTDFINLQKHWDEWALGTVKFLAKCAKEPLVDKGKGVRHHLFRYHPEDLEKVQALAWERLQERVVNVHTSLIEKLDNATKSYEKAVIAAKDAEGNMTEKAQHDTTKTHLTRLRATLKASADDLNGAVLAAENFDATEALSELFSALRKALTSEQKALAAQAEAFNAKYAGAAFKASTNGSRGAKTVWGWHVNGILRLMGKLEWNKERADKTLKAKGCTVPSDIIVTELANGKAGTGGVAAALTGAQIEELTTLSGE